MVALLAEGVDRNLQKLQDNAGTEVALLAEGVDRNKTVVPVWFISNAIALLMEDAGRNYSTAKRVSFQDLPYAVVRSVEPFHLSDHQLRATRWHFWSHTGYFIPMRAKKVKKSTMRLHSAQNGQQNRRAECLVVQFKLIRSLQLLQTKQ